MSEINRALVPFTNEHFAAFCEKMVGQPYWYGCCGYKATASLLTRKTKQYPSYYAASRMARNRQDIANRKVVADCIGGVKGYCWTGGGIGVLEAIGTEQTYSSSYGSNGCPDKGANAIAERKRNELNGNCGRVAKLRDYGTTELRCYGVNHQTDDAKRFRS